MADHGTKLAEHHEDCDIRDEVLQSQFDLLTQLAVKEGWNNTPRFEAAWRKICRTFHLDALLEAREKYNLSDANVQACWDKLWAKFPPHPDEPADA